MRSRIGPRGCLAALVALLLAGCSPADASQCPPIPPRPAPPGALYYVGFGAQRSVSGSLHAVGDGDRWVLVDVGAFMGGEGENHPWPAELPVDRIDAVFLTHAHADHVGRVPLLIEEGYEGPIYATAPTRDLLLLTARQNVHLSDLGVERFYYTRNRQGERDRGGRIPVWLDGLDYGRFTIPEGNRVYVEARRPELDGMDLYLAAPARDSLAGRLLDRLDRQVRVLGPGEEAEAGAVRGCFVLTSHLPGAAAVRLAWGSRSVVFSGDVGSNFSPLLPLNATWRESIEALFVEATYTEDSAIDPAAEQKAFRREVGRLVREGYRVVIPAFVMDRTQQVLLQLRHAEREGELPMGTPVHLFSRSAAEILDLYEGWAGQAGRSGGIPYFSETMASVDFRPSGLRLPGATPSVDSIGYGEVAVTSSGMADFASSRASIESFLSDDRTVFYFVGFQAEETLGRRVRDGSGAGEIFEIDGTTYPSRAATRSTSGFSGHARPSEIERIYTPGRPGEVFLVHSEGEPPRSLQERYQAVFGGVVTVPEVGRRYELFGEEREGEAAGQAGDGR